MATNGQEPNVTREGKTVHVKRSFVKGVTADFVKHEIKLTLAITLDESSLSIRDDMAFWAFDETPVALVLKPARTQLGLPGLTLDPDERAVAEDMMRGDDEDA